MLLQPRLPQGHPLLRCLQQRCHLSQGLLSQLQSTLLQQLHTLQ
jgi:hypothetical protein